MQVLCLLQTLACGAPPSPRCKFDRQRCYESRALTSVAARISKKAIPFATTVQTLLKVELGVECRMGATFGEAYCGVVGGVSRHEYAILGPSVNLAARLMAYPENKGLLVAESVKQKAGSRQFRALPPVKAKGYSKLVPIFAPVNANESGTKGGTERHIGQRKKLEEVVSIAEDIIESGGPARTVFVTAALEVDKSAFGIQTRAQIREMCEEKNAPNLSLSLACSEEDLMVPFRYVDRSLR